MEKNRNEEETQRADNLPRIYTKVRIKQRKPCWAIKQNGSVSGAEKGSEDQAGRRVRSAKRRERKGTKWGE